MHDDVESDLADRLARVPAPGYDPELIEETIMNAPTDRRRPLVIAVIVLSIIVVMMALALWNRSDAPIRGVDPLNTPTPTAPRTSDTPSTPFASNPTGSGSPTSAPTEPGSPETSPAEDSTVVDAQDYAALGGAGQGHYFVSPSGYFLCGITEGIVGCQSTVVISGMESCGTTPQWRTAMVSWSPGNPAEPTCTTQGVFTTESAATVLDYDTSLSVGDTVCTARTTGISCVSVTTGTGFTIATQGIEVQS